MTNEGHPDDEALNLHLDAQHEGGPGGGGPGGGGPGGGGSADAEASSSPWADHLTGCAPCSVRLQGLATVRNALAAPVDVPTEARERALTAALAAYDDTQRAHREPGTAQVTARAATDAVPSLLGRSGPGPASMGRIASRRRPAYLAVGSVAAVLLALVAMAGVLTRSDGGGGGNQALSSRQKTDALSAPPATGGDAEAAAGFSDLGEIADADALVTKVTGAGRATAESSTGRSSSATGSASADASATNSGDTGDATASAGSAPSASPPALGSPGALDGPSSVANSGARSEALASPGLNPVPPPMLSRCEQLVRSSHPGAGDIVYRATARQGDRPAVVFGLRPPSSSSGEQGSPLTLVMVAQDDCRVLFEVAVP